MTDYLMDFQHIKTIKSKNSTRQVKLQTAEKQVSITTQTFLDRRNLKILTGLKIRNQEQGTSHLTDNAKRMHDKTVHAARVHDKTTAV